MSDILVLVLYPVHYGLTGRAHGRSISDVMRPGSARRLFQAVQQAWMIAALSVNRQR